MGDKKNEMKFTILFSPANPDHVFTANKLNSQSRNNKANYLAQAVRFFEENNSLNTSAVEKTIVGILGKLSASYQAHPSDEDTDDEMSDKLKQNIHNSLQIFKTVHE